ncbi:unnamed protein product [Larinioides sclopetarius]|uniref:Uncharacterized protein n=1 Tax=Larinioides sclopetarius TaxID=280406 RepID=A0AAV1ZJH0_9ARAC
MLVNIELGKISVFCPNELLYYGTMDLSNRESRGSANLSRKGCYWSSITCCKHYGYYHAQNESDNLVLDGYMDKDFNMFE